MLILYKSKNKILEHAVAKSYDDIHNTLTVPYAKTKVAIFCFFNNEKHYCIIIYTLTLCNSSNVIICY